MQRQSLHLTQLQNVTHCKLQIISMDLKTQWKWNNKKWGYIVIEWQSLSTNLKLYTLQSGCGKSYLTQQLV